MVGLELCVSYYKTHLLGAVFTVVAIVSNTVLVFMVSLEQVTRPGDGSLVLCNETETSARFNTYIFRHCLANSEVYDNVTNY